ncbi:MAG: N-6 DNA methylase [Truepera sp.]|nr:N-6 DNA methylase [Truepera sp.]
MANEAKTEAFVRKHFEQFDSDLTIEEKQSDSPRVKQLLKNASKKGSGEKGYPDFIISVADRPDFLIIVECKADPLKHESPTRDNWADFAVDGALWYASHLCRGFDVLAIGASGSGRHKKVSHFLHLKGETSAKQIFGDRLLPLDDYIKGYLGDPDKARQDYHSLLEFIRRLNVRLHKDKVAESHRALLISAALIALEHAAFRDSYLQESNSRDLAARVVTEVSKQLRDANIPSDRLEVLEHHFGFIKTETALLQKENELRDIIQLIDDEFNSYKKNHEYQDVLGRLYVEFLRYANSVKGLGIVLTPPHITEFFADLAQVSSESIVYDNCTGTGGFLISAMKRMIADAKGNTRIEQRIKESQLFGVELQSIIYPLAVSNMYIHQDGKSNIVLGSCFDEDVMEHIKAKNPNVGLLNPPYKADKKNDTEELEYVLNNLECLRQGGICVAIVPMQCALSTEGKIADLKKQLMEKHTLDCVLSMPTELFFNSKVAVVSCVMRITAHYPHPENKQVYLGYYRDDGFVKRRVGGRIDAHGVWDEIKKKWLEGFMNRRNEPGFSVNKVVTPDMEWAAEAYMETDYSTLSRGDFENTILNYVTFLHANRLIDKVSPLP